MQQTTQQPATVIRLRTDRFDERARELGLDTENALAEYLGISRWALYRVRKGDAVPGEKFIAACLSSKFARSFEWLFQLGEAS